MKKLEKARAVFLSAIQSSLFQIDLKVSHGRDCQKLILGCSSWGVTWLLACMLFLTASMAEVC
jgi:hypothetical protein